jgi:pilus assembly protein Flp/PilA
MSEKKGKHRILERGQGLVEYALILILAAIVVIVVLGLFGERIRNFYCEVVLSIAPDVDAPACNQLSVSCNVLAPKPLRMEAAVTDNQGPKDIKTVKWFVDGKPYNTEYYYKYCLQSGNGPCDPYTGSKGKHTFSAVVTDAEGHTGKCSKTVVVEP